MNYAEMKKSHIQGSLVIRKFLMKLGVPEIRKTNNLGCDFEFVCPDGTVSTVRAVVNPNKSENLFAETYVTRRKVDGDGRDMLCFPGNIYICPATYFFFLTGTKLCIVPSENFRLWVDRKAHTFQTVSELYWYSQQEIHRHGLLIPIERVRTEFAKGNSCVSIFEIKYTPGRETEIDFIQEL